MSNQVTNALSQNPTNAELLAQIAALTKANADLQAKSVATAKNGLKISEKGCVSLYGLSKFPVSFYPEQWRKIFAQSEVILAFIADGEKAGKLLPKAAKQAVTA